MSSQMEKTIVPNEVYNVVRALAAKLEGLAAYNKYEEDGGPPKDVWQQLRSQDEQAVKQLMQQLEQLAKNGQLRLH
jgi:hypothetical protein